MQVVFFSSEAAEMTVFHKIIIVISTVSLENVLLTFIGGPKEM